ncbi:hypothetical protein, partial [Niveibacterium sp. COAC-50]|uniref:hypothetical protein n=1 Tax=Niveibacterium sp. COAC-50 TaxID=2729384 RepID=UPI001C131511
YKGRLAVFIHAMQRKHVLGQIDSKDHNFHGLPLHRDDDELCNPIVALKTRRRSTGTAGWGMPFHSLGHDGPTLRSSLHTAH